MSREENVIDLQITIINEIKRLCGLSYSRVSYLFNMYGVLPYIETGYEYFNSMGIVGIIEEIREFIGLQGGKLE